MSGAPHRRPDVLAAVALGGALGAPARYGVELLVPAGPHAFPWATFLTNASGSLLLGTLLVLIHDRWPPSRYARPFLASGFLGAYTTFSSYVLQVDLLAKDGHAGTAAGYAVASLLIGLLLAWLGIAIGRRLAGP
ncbi:MAG: CrcB family protein [Mycobacteriales bacterium]